MRTKRLYRVTAIFPGTTTRRDYQTKTAAEHHAAVLRDQSEGRLYPPPATLVTVTVSDPITWPAS